MTTQPISGSPRLHAIEAVAASLPQRASRLVRLLLRYAKTDMTRGNAGVLLAVADAPRRITELAELEGLTQPAITNQMAKLEERGWVRRVHDAADRRIVHVAITEEGRSALSAFRTAVRELLTARMASMSDEQVGALVAAAEALAVLIDALQPGDDR